MEGTPNSEEGMRLRLAALNSATRATLGHNIPPMAKVHLRAGAEVDFLNEEEFSRRMDRYEAFFENVTRQQEGETVLEAAPSFSTDSSGNTSSLPNGGGTVYQVPTGYDAFLTRLSVDYAGSNASSPKSCDVRAVADSNDPSALRLIYNIVPMIWEGSKSHAPIFRGGQRIVVAIAGGPTSTQMFSTVQVVLIKRKAVRDDAPANAEGFGA